MGATYAHRVTTDPELILPARRRRDRISGGSSASEPAEPAEPNLPGWLIWFDRGGPAWTAMVMLAVTLLVGAVGYVIGVRTTEPSSGAIDVGFLQDMTDHHEQAVTMALVELTNGSDTETLGFAREVLTFQRWELGKMDAYLEARKVQPFDYDPERPVMRWMDMGGTLAEMPGMASAAQLDQFKAATGVAADRLFLTLMTEHHRGGLHMAKFAQEHASDSHIRDLAGVMARNQQGEIVEYARAITRLGT